MFLGRIARADPSVDHTAALRSNVDPLPSDCNCRSGRLYQDNFGGYQLTDLTAVQ